MSKIKFAIIADDNTGATDAAGMLTEKGVKTCLINDFEAIANVSFLNNYDAIVLGTQSRSVPAKEAYETTKKALKFLEQFSPEMVQIKYCSTFDSTKEGNIGSFLDAMLDFSGQKSIIVCPALPVNGRATYMGYHFVKGELLSESPLRNHPINPMTDSNLVRWLQYQTKRKVGLLSLEVIQQGDAAIKDHLQQLENKNITYVVSDAVCQDDIKATVKALGKVKMISGGSGITAEIPGILFPDAGKLSFDNKINNLPKGMLVVSGSMSPATKSQNEYALKSGLFEGYNIDPVAIVKGTYDIDKAVKETAERIYDKAILIYSPYKSKAEVHAVADEMGISHTEAGIRIGDALAEIGERMVKEYKVGKLLIAGGETSGVTCKKLNINELDIGLPLDPGVPYCFPIHNPELMLVLKSGNFGSVDLYEKVYEI
jgi:3-dehydrotetronate 4-kinase